MSNTKFCGYDVLVSRFGNAVVCRKCNTLKSVREYRPYELAKGDTTCLLCSRIRANKYQSERWKKDPSYRTRQKKYVAAYQKRRRAADPEFRDKLNRRSRNRYYKNSEHNRAAHADRYRERYNAQEEFRRQEAKRKSNWYYRHRDKIRAKMVKDRIVRSLGVPREFIPDEVAQIAVLRNDLISLSKNLCKT